MEILFAIFTPGASIIDYFLINVLGNGKDIAFERIFDLFEYQV